MMGDLYLSYLLRTILQGRVLSVIGILLRVMKSVIQISLFYLADDTTSVSSSSPL